MAKTDYRDVYVKCPYFVGYEKDGKREIKCEGFMQRQYIINRFPSQSAEYEWTMRFCNNVYTHCPLARALSERYEE